MNKALFGLCICILLVGNIVSTINIEAGTTKRFGMSGDIIVVGVMHCINVTEEYKEYKIHVAVILKESIDIFIEEDDILRIYNPHGLEMESIVVLFCDTWELIRER